MNRRSTRDDVARQAGVSKTTVTYVLGERHDIAIPEATRERVRYAAQELGYRPHAAAKALRSGRTQAITVAFPVRIGAHNAHILQVMERQTNENGFRMVATTIGRNGTESVETDLSAISSSLTDGIILVDMPAVFHSSIESNISKGKAIVSVGVFTVPNTNRVEVNLEQAAHDAFLHLMDSGRRRIAIFGAGIHEAEDVFESFAAQGQLDPRLSAYRRSMHEAGYPLEVIPGSPGSRRASVKAIQTYVAQEGCPDALFCWNDEMAVAASFALRGIGYRIPEDVLLVGCDGLEEGEYMNPSLSTIVQPVEQMCAGAWRLMVNCLDNPAETQRQHIRMNAKFVGRDSSQQR
ncbi:MAG: LacI family DNA-binding transcriptional regulator [Fibrella sp.]|nr:LacI family DNA-binding transcriptional regulator [Armatimonadota bacterium]